MEENPDLYRLEGSNSSETGGLIIAKKRPSDHTFKKPQTSIFGLDKLAEKRRKENAQEPSGSRIPFDSCNAKDRKYRTYSEETPTHTGGVDKIAQEKLEIRLMKQNLDRNIKDKAKRREYEDRDRRRYDDKDRYRNSKKDRSKYVDSVHSRDRSSRRDRTPRFRDEPRTPKYKLKDSTSKTNWDDDDDDDGPSKKSSWDHPTPNLYSSKDIRDSIRSEFTPSYKFNAWVKDRKMSGATPMIDSEERELWEQEQKKLDREWYGLGDDETRHFNDVSEEYTQKKEMELEARKQKRVSAQQRQINKDNELWERNRMLTSGVVSSLDHDEDVDDEGEARVHLLVHNVVPPFLDGMRKLFKYFAKILISKK